MPFAHSLSCWVKLFSLKKQQRQLLIGDENAVTQLYIDQGRPHFSLSLPEGIYTCSGTEELPADTWLNLAATVERPSPFATPQLHLFLNGEQLQASTQLRAHPYYQFDLLTDQGYTFDGKKSYAQFVLTHNQHPGGSFTMEMWVKPEKLNANQSLWHKDAKTNGVLTLLQGGRLRLELGTFNHDGSLGRNTVESENALASKEWNYLAVTVHFSGRQTPLVQFIINDTIEAPILLPQAESLRWDEGLHILGRSPLKIGRRTPYFQGQMAAFRIWKGIRQPLDLLSSKRIPQPEGLKEMLVDQFTWPDYAFDPEGEGGDWPSPGEIVLHPSVVRSDTPQWSLHGGMEQAQELYLSYQYVPWRGHFHLGGWAPASAARFLHHQYMVLPKGKTLDLDPAHQSFTCEMWVKTRTGGGLWQFAAPDHQTSALSLRLSDGKLLLDMGPQDGVQHIPLPQLFDDQWHLLSLRFDRSYSQSDDAIVWLSVDGQDAGVALANGSADTKDALFIIGNAPDVLGTESDIQLRDFTFWNYLRSPAQIAAARHHRPAGTEYGLVAHWPLDTIAGDDSSKKRYQLAPVNAPVLVSCPGRLGTSVDESLSGILAEVRLWDIAQSQAAIRQTLFLPLDGKEYGLTGYWRLGAIWEEDRRVTDFSAFGNDGLLYGDLYLSPDTLPRRIGTTANSPLATAYRNDDLVAVSERAVYEATFEYRLLKADNKPITTATALKNAFAFELRGKTSRTALDWIEHNVFAPQIISEIIGIPVSNTARTSDKDYSWYKATCRFVVPDGVRLFRVMGLQNVAGNWERMEIRKHHLIHISDAITQTTYSDNIDTLETLVGDIPSPDIHTATQQMNAQMVVAKRKRISQLDELIQLAQGEANALTQQLTRAKQEWSNAHGILKHCQQQYNALANNPYNYYWRIKAKHSGKYLALPRSGLRTMTLKANTNSRLIDYAPGSEVTQQSIPQAHQMDFVIERVNDRQFRLRVGNSSFYLAGFREITTQILFVKQSIQPQGTTIGVVEKQHINEVLDIDVSTIKIYAKAFSALFQAFWNVGLIPILDKKSLQEARNVASRTFRINVEGTGLAFDITGSKQEEGARCLQWTYNSPASANQFFMFEIQDITKVLRNNPNRYPNKDLAQAEDALYAAQSALTTATQAYNTALAAAQQGNQLPEWIAERDRLHAEVNAHYANISQAQQDYLQAVARANNTAQALPLLNGNDPNGLQVKGAFLGFAQATGQLSMMESAEGKVLLSYTDRYGRLKQTAYDVTADSQNPYFEEWLPDGAGIGQQFGKNSHLTPNSKLQLGSEFTLEWWMPTPFDENQKENDAVHSWTFPILTMESGVIFPMVIQRPEKRSGNNELALLLKNQIAEAEGLALLQKGFVDPENNQSIPLIELNTLSTGWHHFAIVKKGVGADKNLLLYVDGELWFSWRKKVAEFIETVEETDRPTVTKTLNSALDYLDDPTQLEIQKIGGLVGDTEQPRLAELRIWSAALDGEEIRYNSKVELTGHEPSLLVYYKLNEADSGVVRNFAQANSEYDATPSGNIDPVPFPATLGGVNQKVTFFPTEVLPLNQRLPRAAVRTFSATKPKAFDIQSISFWVKADHRMAASRLVSIMDEATNLLDFTLLVGVAGEISLNSARMAQSISPAGTFPYGQWVHIALNMEQGEAQLLKVYMNGQLIGASAHLLLPAYPAQSKGVLEFGWFRGEMAEFCASSQPLDSDTLAMSYQKPMSAGNPNLLVYFPFNKADESYRIINEADPDRPLIFEEGYGYAIHHAIDLPLAAPNVVTNEYSTIAIDPATGAKKAMMRRFMCVPTRDGADLFCDKRLEELELLWIGNTQFKPTLLGYIEGAPPVPSENFTVPDKLEGYNGATSVSLETEESVDYQWSRSQEVAAGFDLDLFLGNGGDLAFNAPIIGRIKVGEAKAGFKAGLSFAYTFLNSSTVTASSSLITTDTLALSGSPEETPNFEHLGRRFIPKNVGYALVVSGLADVFVLRLKRSKKMVSYSVQANDDLPLDINTITFLINPTYTMNGSLDGMTGTKATSQRFFRQVPEMRAQYGSLYPASYFRLREAYDLKQQIEKEDKRRAAYFDNFNSRLVDETSLDRNVNNSEFDPGNISVQQDVDLPAPAAETEGTDTKENDYAFAETNKKDMKKKAGDQAKQVEAEGKKRRQEIDARIAGQDQKANASYQLARWQKKMEDLQIRASKRNIVNTYVWDADGGLRTESQQFSNIVEHTIGGSVDMNANLGFQVEASVIGISVGLTALATVSLNQTLTKTSIDSKGFALNVDLSGVESTGITDYNDTPLLPGEKVDRYRFMSFYLEGNTNHFHDFFNDVVDPEWLASNSEEARALRQTQQGPANPAWRILHRVTYVERPALKGFGQDQRASIRPIQRPTDPQEELLARLKSLEKQALQEQDGNEALRQEVLDMLAWLKERE
ncbi:MAG: LamG-like jellyroll fold domain-containing protein [Saprospiraceae bacterium]